MSADLMFTPAVELAAMVRRGEISPLELLDACLERMDHDPVNAIVTVAEDSARAAAIEATHRAGDEDLPPFHGVPIAIKDLHLTAGVRTTFGTKALADYVPDIDDEHVARLRAAGFIVVAKTNVPEFGSVPFTESELLGPCRNPWDLDRTSGGSSGGSAAALAAGLVPVASGSDGGGSCRIPASNCGIVGVKPSRGRISNGPLFGDVPAGLTTPGPLSRHVVDAAAVLDVMQGYAVGDPHWAPPPARPYRLDAQEDPGRLRIGLMTTSPLAKFSEETIAAAQEAAAMFESLGHDVEPLDAAPVDESFKLNFEIVWAAGIGSLPIPPEMLEPFNAQLGQWSRRSTAAELMQAIAALQTGARAIVEVTSAYDVVVSPTLMRDPLHIGELAHLVTDPQAMFDALTEYVGLAPVANVTGQPSMSLPMARHADGLPLGIMLTGRPGDEATLFRLAGQAQRAQDWTEQRPPAAA